ncbi:MAG: DUF5674 family protein [Clostridiales Family XIII bacterium]|jgi:hypothetical protein|nr:DUF5674 family protein [Clostridiales Family XIII bacterium]
MGFILDSKIAKKDLFSKCDIIFDDDFVKGVVDIKTKRLAIDAELHAELEALFVAEGASNGDLWGINLYPSEDEKFVEFDSLINLKPSHNNRIRGISDPKIAKRVLDIVELWII